MPSPLLRSLRKAEVSNFAARVLDPVDPELMKESPGSWTKANSLRRLAQNMGVSWAMDDAQIQEIVDRVVTAIESLRPVSEPDAGFWQTLSFAPVATLTVGVLAAIIAGLALRQRSRSDARAEWWRRTQWALDNIPDGGQDADQESETNREILAYAVLGVQVENESAKKVELDVIEAILPFVPKGEGEEVEAIVDEVENLPSLPSELREQLEGYQREVHDVTLPGATVDATADSVDTGDTRRESHE